MVEDKGYKRVAEGGYGYDDGGKRARGEEYGSGSGGASLGLVSTNGGSGSMKQGPTPQPSKVLHVRNLPWECTAEELSSVCSQFGKVVQCKMSVGANKNQAFVEMGDVAQAIALVQYYAAAPEPAQIRGKSVYFQYSTRQEIVSGKQSGDAPGNVLLVTIEDAQMPIPIETLHTVFMAFGLVQKITTFEKSAGFQSLVQFSDPQTATSAKNALEGHNIPRFLLPPNAGVCTLRISYSAHTDLNVKFQSHRSRDFMNPYLPVAPSAGDPSLPAIPDGHVRENESNVLLASVDNMQYPVTIDVLHTVFSTYGLVQKIAIFEKSQGFQALIQYGDIATASIAKSSLEGHAIYDGGYCRLRLTYSKHTDLNVRQQSDKSRDYTTAGSALAWDPKSTPTPAAPAASRPGDMIDPMRNPAYGGAGYPQRPPGPGSFPGAFPPQFGYGVPGVPGGIPPQPPGGFPRGPVPGAGGPPGPYGGPAGPPVPTGHMAGAQAGGYMTQPLGYIGGGGPAPGRPGGGGPMPQGPRMSGSTRPSGPGGVGAGRGYPAVGSYGR